MGERPKDPAPPGSRGRRHSPTELVSPIWNEAGWKEQWSAIQGSKQWRIPEEDTLTGGPFILLTPRGKPQVGYVEVQNVTRLTTDIEEVRVLAARYGSIRAQALTPRESLALIERMQTER